MANNLVDKTKKALLKYNKTLDFLLQSFNDTAFLNNYLKTFLISNIGVLSNISTPLKVIIFSLIYQCIYC